MRQPSGGRFILAGLDTRGFEAGELRGEQKRPHAAIWSSYRARHDDPQHFRDPAYAERQKQDTATDDRNTAAEGMVPYLYCLFEAT